MDRQPDVLRDRQDPWSQSLESSESRLEVGPLGDTKRSELRVRVSDATLHPSAQPLRMTKVEDANAPTRDLVFIGRADSPPCCADLPARGAHRIDELVIRENQVNAVTDI